MNYEQGEGLNVMNSNKQQGYASEIKIMEVLSSNFERPFLRCWSSDGRSAGLSSKVDLYNPILGLYVQCKSTSKNLPLYLQSLDKLEKLIADGNHPNEPIVFLPVQNLFLTRLKHVKFNPPTISSIKLGINTISPRVIKDEFIPRDVHVTVIRRLRMKFVDSYALIIPSAYESLVRRDITLTEPLYIKHRVQHLYETEVKNYDVIQPTIERKSKRAKR